MLTDEKGLHLYITPTGFKSWRYKYRFDGKEKQLAFGPWPEVSLWEARDRRDDARRILRDGIDPSAKAPADHAPTLRQVTMRWLALQSEVWKPKHAANVLTTLEAEVLPTLGSRRINAIVPADLIPLLSNMQARGATEAAHRVRSRLSYIFQHAVAAGEASFDPAAALSAVLKPVVKRKHPAILDIRARLGGSGFHRTVGPA